MARIRDLDMLKNIDIIYGNKIILYGMGDCGKRTIKLLNRLEIPVYGLCDSDKAKWGEEINGCKIMSTQELAEIPHDEHLIIIITIMGDLERIDQVLQTLDAIGMAKVPCYTYFALKYTIELHINDHRIKDLYREDFLIAKEAYRKWILTGSEMHVLEIIGKILQQDIVLIYQPGKVGSSTVYESLIRAGVNCIHSHVLISDWFGGRFIKDGKNGIRVLHNAEKIRIISLIREPIGRDISKYFQSFLEYVIFDFVKPDSYEGVNRYLEDNTKMGECGAVFEWFNMEIKEAFGIDVYQYEFDKKKGYQLIQKDNVEILLIKAERLDDCQEVIGQFTGVEDFTLLNVNVGNEKLYKYAYNELKSTIKIPEYIADFYYKGNKAMDHFYTEEEKREFAKKWIRK